MNKTSIFCWGGGVRLRAVADQVGPCMSEAVYGNKRNVLACPVCCLCNDSRLLSVVEGYPVRMLAMRRVAGEKEVHSVPFVLFCYRKTGCKSDRYGGRASEILVRRKV
jgi:hypothetical protein